MKRQFAVLQTVEHKQTITAENHRVFARNLQRALLLALRDRGRLDERQYRLAEDGRNDRQKTAKGPQP